MACNIDCTSWEHSDRPGFHGDPDIAGLGVRGTFGSLSYLCFDLIILLAPDCRCFYCE